MTTIHNDMLHAFSLRDSFAETTVAPPTPAEDSFDEHLHRAQDTAAEAPPTAPAASPPSAQNASAAPTCAAPKRNEDEKPPGESAAEAPAESLTDDESTSTKTTEPNDDAPADEVHGEKPAKGETKDDDDAKNETVKDDKVATDVVVVVTPPVAREAKVEMQAKEFAETPPPTTVPMAVDAAGDAVAREQATQAPVDTAPVATFAAALDGPATARPKAETVEKEAQRGAAAVEPIIAEAADGKPAVHVVDLPAAEVPVRGLAASSGPRENTKDERGEDKGRGQRSMAAAAAPAVDDSMPDAPHEVAPQAAVVPAAVPGLVAAAPEAAARTAPNADNTSTAEVGPVEGTRKPSDAAPAGAKDTGPAQPGHPAGADPARFVQRVANAFRAASDANNTLRLKLSPPELGSLRLEITVHSGAMTARLEAETVETRNLLLDNLPALRERLAQQDIKIQHFQVDLADRRPGGGADQAAGQFHRHEQGHSPPGGPRATRTTTAPPTVAPPAARRLNDNSQLNVIV